MSAPAIERSDICAIVVTYFPKLSCVENLLALAPEVGRILIVDNGSSAAAFDPVQAVAGRLGAAVMCLGSNLGIAAALNVGLKFAREQGFQWIATFDQDSQVTPGMIEEMTRALASYPERSKVAIATPCHVDRNLGFTVRDRDNEGTGEGWRIIRSTMTSGNLLNVRIATEVGGFDDSLFIDYVDHDFCLRLRRHGYRILEATRATLLHSLGAMERRFFLFKRVTVTNHAVVRHYYRARNRLIVWRRYKSHEPFWVIRDMRRFVFETMYVVLYEREVGAKLPMIMRGLRDGLRDIRGPLIVGGR